MTQETTTEKPPVLNSHDRRVALPQDLFDSFHYIVADEKLKVCPEAAGEITVKGMMLQALKEYARQTGHYPPKYNKKTG
jgi:hypothetical protein